MTFFASLLIGAALAVAAPLAGAQAQANTGNPAGTAAPVPAAPVTPKGPPKPDLAKGEAGFTAVCAACHGADGNSGIPVNPKLAQQHPEYLVKQLQEFKSGKRPSVIMAPIAAALSPDDMRNMSYWVTARKAKSGFGKDKALMAVGERIYRGGIAERQVAACAGCHSPNGAGVPSMYPRLGGQHADYVAAQLLGFRDGGRPNSLLMSQVAARLNDREIRAVSDYIAGLR